LLKAQIPILFAAMAVPRSGQHEGKKASPQTLATQEKEFSKDTKQQTFRKSFTQVELDVQEASVWLCSDGHHSFGAPDVFQVPLQIYIGEIV
jgi:hypothetical protein